MENKNLILAIFLSVTILMGWNYLFEKPRLEKMHAATAQAKKQEVIVTKVIPQFKERSIEVDHQDRIKIENNYLSGSLNLRGLRFDDLTLKGYKDSLDDHDNEVDLLSPSGTKESYFAEIGWHSGAGLQTPDANTIWETNSKTLSDKSPVKLHWTNDKGVKFQIKLSLDKDYMFLIEQSVQNNSSESISFKSYGLINRSFAEKDIGTAILHQGPLAVIDDKLQEETFDKIKEKKYINFKPTNVSWIGISDKYWLNSFIPDKKLNYSSNFNYAVVQKAPKYQTDFLSESIILNPGDNNILEHRFFSGAKKVNLLDHYAEEFNIKLFDRAIDFGWFYILTKPMFHALNFFYGLIGNFGLSILLVTVIIKLLMFVMANKSYRSMQDLKALQPEVDRLKKQYENDQTKFNQELMALYQKHKVNPISGCLPMILQIPVFFSLYKVLYVTLEMRHATFFGWIHDLSAPDPTSMFNLFGLLPFTPPSFLMIGVWPVLMALSMHLQQRMSPPPTDPVQAKMMSLMPLILLVMFSSFPAGLVIYWTWNNLLSILQQKLVIYNYNKS